MTISPNRSARRAENAESSTLPFDPRDLVEMRVLPAQFARMVGVSKQSISKALKAGKIVLGPDGRLDPKRALRDYLNNSDPTRVRVRTFRQAMTETDQLRARVRAQDAELERLRTELESAIALGNAIEQAFKPVNSTTKKTDDSDSTVKN